MSPFQAVVLGVVQGLTEFLPVSSSAHLYLVPTLLKWRYAGVAFDVALHWGTLLALVLAFRRDWWNLARGVFVGSSEDRRDGRATWLKLAVASDLFESYAIPGTPYGLFIDKEGIVRGKGTTNTLTDLQTLIRVQS